MSGNAVHITTDSSPIQLSVSPLPTEVLYTISVSLLESDTPARQCHEVEREASEKERERERGEKDKEIQLERERERQTCALQRLEHAPRGGQFVGVVPFVHVVSPQCGQLCFVFLARAFVVSHSGSFLSLAS